MTATAALSTLVNAAVRRHDVTITPGYSGHVVCSCGALKLRTEGVGNGRPPAGSRPRGAAGPAGRCPSGVRGGGGVVTSNQVLVVRLPVDMHAEVKALAESDERTMAWVVRRALKEYLAARRDGVSS